jgi:hypothetical protein
MEFGDRLGLAGLIMALIGTAVTILWPTKRWIGWTCLLIALGLVGTWGWLEIVSPRPKVELKRGQEPADSEAAKNSRGIIPLNDLITRWGVEGNTCVATINTDQLLPFKDNFRFLVVIRPQDKTVDVMHDDQILKSSLFSIRGGELPIEIPLTQRFLAKAFVTHPIGKGKYEHSATIDFLLVLLPKQFEGEQVVRLSDAETLGGKVLVGKSVGSVPIKKEKIN